jgi:hypothetical protein
MQTYVLIVMLYLVLTFSIIFFLMIIKSVMLFFFFSQSAIPIDPALQANASKGC